MKWKWLYIVVAVLLVALLICIAGVVRWRRVRGKSTDATFRSTSCWLDWILSLESEVVSFFFASSQGRKDSPTHHPVLWVQNQPVLSRNRAFTKHYPRQFSCSADFESRMNSFTCLTFWIRSHFKTLQVKEASLHHGSYIQQNGSACGRPCTSPTWEERWGGGGGLRGGGRLGEHCFPPFRAEFKQGRRK